MTREETFLHGLRVLTARRAELSAPEYKALVAFADANECGSSFTGDQFFIVHDDDGQVKFMFTILERAGVVEIYDVCTATSERRRGLASKFLQFFVTHTPARVIWLGVIAPAPARLYGKLGFVDPVLTNRSPLGRTFPFLFVSLTYKRGATAAAIEQAQKTTKILLAMIPEIAKEPRVAEIFLRYTDYETLDYYVRRRDYEVGGTFTVGTTGKVAIQEYIHGRSFQRQHKMFAVQIPCAHFSYHTHPDAAYTSYDYGLGLPSVFDYMHMIECNSRADLIFSIEGIYTLQMTEFFRALATVLYHHDKPLFDQALKNLQTILSDEHMRKLEFLKRVEMPGDVPMTQVRAKMIELHADPDLQRRIHYVISEFLAFVNSLRWRDVVPAQLPFDPAVDLPAHIFHVGFIPRAEMERFAGTREIPIPLVSYE
jgi:GNAT superfamily N-acetyltransferase